MVNIIALTVIVTGFIIFTRYHMKIQKSILNKLGCFNVWSRIKLDRFVGMLFMLIGVVILAINSYPIKSAIGKCIYLSSLFYICLGVILLTAIYTIITNQFYNEQAYNSIDESEFSSLSLGKKIQEMMESKRQLSYKFHHMYWIALGFLIASLVLPVFTVVILKMPYNELVNPFLTIMTPAVTLFITVKALFLNEVTTINQWIPILYSEDSNLASDELNRIRNYDKQQSRNFMPAIGLVNISRHKGHQYAS